MGFPSVLISIFHLMPCGNDGMAAHSDLDETMCKRTLCPHPQCWVSFRRIEQGNPRYRPPGSVTRLPSQDAGGLPFLSVTTLPSCQTPPNDNELHQLHVSSLLTFSAESAPRECTLYSSAATCSMDKVLFPGVNSLRGMRGPSRSPESYASSHRKTAQVDVVDPYFKDGRSRHMTMIWVPNAQQKPQTKDSEKPPKVQIKYLTLADMPGGEKGETWNPALPAHRKKKPPTGGCPHNLTLASSSPPVPAHTKTWMSGSSVKDHPEVMTKNRRWLYDHFPDKGSQAYPALDNTLLENRRVVLHDTRARRQHSPAVPHTGGPVYRLDEQQFAALDNMEMNLDSIRNQYYLWKKYIDMTRPSRRIKPPGSVVCDVARSSDSGSRDSPSSPGFSQSSGTGAEPYNTPREMDAVRKSQQDVPGAGDRDGESVEPPGDRDSAQVLPDIEQEHLPEEEESTRPNVSPDPAEPSIRSLEITDVQESSEGGVSSPQPNPPPPSPVR
ncbi:uncharacterized protein LOC134948308 isoform X2 [Pseudophryne corroboree]|uniref:uncharacterized protein LOC134948308 isoform X2 n=1 Tax=Pseudophryne corroboree TaxID=495146 RepID=UPI0030813931